MEHTEVSLTIRTGKSKMPPKRRYWEPNIHPFESTFQAIRSAYKQDMKNGVNDDSVLLKMILTRSKTKLLTRAEWKGCGVVGPPDRQMAGRTCLLGSFDFL